MGQIGGVYIPDELMPRIAAPKAQRPSFGAIFGSALEGTARQVAAALPYQFEVLTRDKVDPGLEQQYRRGLDAANAAFARAAPATLDDATSGRVGVGRFIAENIVGMAPQFGVAALGAVGGGIVGGPGGALVGAAAAGTPLFSASNTARAVEENDGLTVDAAERSLAIAPLQAGTDALLGRFLPGVGKILGPAASTQTGGFISRTAKSMVKAGATEAVTEAAQQMGERAAAGIDLGSPDAVAEYVNAAVTAFAVGGTLGAGGGFRRTNADAKPAEAVTEADMLSKIDGYLDGSLRVSVPRVAPVARDANGNQLTLPSPEPLELGSVPETRSDGLNPDVALTDAAGRTVLTPNTRPDLDRVAARLANLPRPSEQPLDLGDVPDSFPDNFNPDLRAALASVLGPRQEPLAASTTLSRGLDPDTFDGQPGVELPEGSFRPFKDDSVDDIQAAVRDSKSAPQLKQAADEELARRAQEAVGEAELTTDDFQTRVDELKTGLRGGFVQQLTATDPNDLADKVYNQIFVEQDTRSNTRKLAQRMGILDQNMEPGPLAAKVEERRAAGEQVALAEQEDGGTPSGPLEASLAGLRKTAREAKTLGRKTIAAVENLGEVATEIRERKAALARDKISRGERITRSEFTYLAQEEAIAQGRSPASVRWDDLRESYNQQYGIEPATPPVTERVSTAAAQAVPVDGPTAEVQDAVKAAGIQRQSPALKALNLNTPADVFAALANDALPEGTRGQGAQVTQVEKIARKLGLITDDDAMDITPKGRTVFLQSSGGLEATTSAAADQGYTGASASQFDRGARAAVGGPEQTTFSGFEEMAAYEAGKVWAQDFVTNGETKTAAQTAAIQGRLDARTTGRAVDQKAASRRELTPEQLRVQSLNRLIDNAELSSARDTDIAELRRMARNGASPDDLGRAIQNVQAGRSLFDEGPRTPYVAKPERASRGQPRFKEMNTRTEAGRAQMRAETTIPVRIFELRNLVQFALQEKAITKARADRLNAMLDNGDIKAVEKSMKNFLAEMNAEMNVGRATGVADPQFEQFVGDKDFMGVLDHMVDQAPSQYHRAIMSAVRSLAKRMEAMGVAFEFRVIRPGDEVPAALLPERTRALTIVSRVPAKSTVYLKSIELGNGSGMNYQMAAHEMIHAVTMGIMQRGGQRGVLGSTKLGKAVEDLIQLQDAIYAHFTKRAEEGNLNEFEERFAREMNNSLANIDEILAWGLTNPGMQRYLATIEYRPKQSLFGRFRELLGNLLGLPVKYDTALTELLRVSEQIMDTSNAELAATFPRNNFQLTETGVLMAAVDDAGSANRTAQATNDVTQKIAGMANTVVDALKPEDFVGRARRTMLGWVSHNQIDRMFGALMPGLIKHSDAHRERVAVRSRYEQMFDTVYQAFEKLERETPNAAKWVGELMALSTEFQLDPDKAFTDHAHLGWVKDADGNTAPRKGAEADIARLAPLHAKAVKLKNDLRRGKGDGWKVFSEFRALNEAQNFSRMAAELHSLVAMDPELSLGVEDAKVNPVDRFMREQGLTDAAAIRDWWSAALDRQIAQAKAFMVEKNGDAARTGNQQDVDAMKQYLSPIELRIEATYRARAEMAKAPYFHLGRFGNYFGSAVVARQQDGTADPKAMAKLAAALEKAGFDDVQISTDNTRPRFMLRFETENEMRNFEKLMLQLQREGVIARDEEIKRGPRNSDQNFGVADGLPEYVSRYIQSLESSTMFKPDDSMSTEEKVALEKQKQDAIRLAIDTWLDQQPDSSISKVLVKRYEVPGYKKDMIRNAAHRWRVGSISLANVASAPKFNQAYVEMRSQVNEAVTVDSENPGGDPVLLNDLMREMRKRDSGNPINDTADTFDKLRAVSHAYFLGMSPAYGMINMTQLGVVAIPELAKRHGYTKSFSAMRRGGNSALKIMKAVMAEARQLGPKNWADVAITEGVLRKAGLSPDEINFTLQMMATGTIDIGSAARALGQIADDRVGSKVDIGLKYASAIGMYTETFSRLTTALTARDLQGGSSADTVKYATQVVSDSMFDYQNWNTARQLGKQGFLGPVTPIVTQFMSYSVQITEKLYSEVLSAAGRPRAGESAAQTAARKKEAFRFLTGHLTAVTALAGTLGLPFATVFAAVIERLVDAFDDDDEPFDATAAYRNFVSDVFGQQVGEVVSRGLPRALGFDISQRAGEQNLLPFSEFIADRRPWKEAMETYAGRSLGAVPSMISNVISGGGKLADGDLLGGMKDVLPVAFKGPIETYRMTSEGYVDTRGNKLPMTPGASAYLWQVMGFSPAERAEYSEARADQASRRGEINRRAQQLRQRITKAMLEGDTATAAELVADAQQFDQDNPAFAVIPSLAGSIQRQMTARSRAAALQTPTGVGLNDIAGQQLTNYANINVTQ